MKATVASILSENKQLKKELTELKASVELKDKELCNLKTKLSHTTMSNTQLKTELNSTTTLLHSTKKNLEDHTIDNLEQYMGKNSLEFHGVPERVYETTEEAVLKIAEALYVKFHTN